MSFVTGDLLMTYDGTYKPIEEILEGDVLITHTGKAQKVDRTSTREVDTDLFTVKFEGYYSDLSVTREHKVYVLRKEDVLCKYSKKKGTERYCDQNKRHHMCVRTGCKRSSERKLVPVLIPVEEIMEGDFLYTPISKKVIHSDIKTIEQARLLGYYCAEGCLCNKTSGVNFTFHEDEKDFIDEVVSLSEKVCDDLNGIRIQNNPEEHSCDVFVKSKFLNAYFRKHCKGKSSEKTLSPELLYAKEELQRHFLATYWNGDGCQCLTKGNQGRIDFRTASKNLSDQIPIILSRCGYPARASYSRAKSTSKLILKNSKKELFDIYTVSFAPSTGGLFFDMCNVKRCGTSGRGSSVRIIDGMVLRKVTSVGSKKYKGTVYDVRVPGDYSVVCNGVAVAQCRYYFENEPKVAAAINFYSMFPMNGFENECPDPKIKMFFDNTCKRLNLDYWTQMISHEEFLIGDVFPFTEFECKLCGGSGVDPTNPGMKCRHPNGTIKRIIVLNPDWIDVQWNILADEPLVTLTPDDELRRIVLQKTPRQIYDKLPINVRNLVATGQPIPLSNRAVKHLKHNASPYQTYGTSLIRRLFKTLAYKDKLMTAQWIVAERMILPIRVVKVGNDERPAGVQDIADMQAQLGAVSNDPNLTLITHHAFEYDWYGACHDDETEILTNDGWKYFSELTGDEIVATYNMNNEEMQFQQIQKYHEYDYDSDTFGGIIHFKHRSTDVRVTPNHRMLVRRHGLLQAINSQDIQDNDKFVSTAKWRGAVPKKSPYAESPVSHFQLDDYLKLVGYYLS